MAASRAVWRRTAREARTARMEASPSASKEASCSVVGDTYLQVPSRTDRAASAAASRMAPKTARRPSDLSATVSVMAITPFQGEGMVSYPNLLKRASTAALWTAVDASRSGAPSMAMPTLSRTAWQAVDGTAR